MDDKPHAIQTMKIYHPEWSKPEQNKNTFHTAIFNTNAEGECPWIHYVILYKLKTITFMWGNDLPQTDKVIAAWVGINNDIAEAQFVRAEYSKELWTQIDIVRWGLYIKATKRLEARWMPKS